MVLFLFTLLSWIFIIIFFTIDKSLSRIKNMILFLCFNIIIINLFTVLILNLKLIQNNTKPELYFCILLQRNVIIPFNLLIYVNSANSSKKYKGSIAGVCIFSTLVSIEMLLKWLGIKIYTGWSVFATANMLIILIIVSNLLAKLLIRVLEGRSKHGCNL